MCVLYIVGFANTISCPLYVNLIYLFYYNVIIMSYSNSESTRISGVLIKPNPFVIRIVAIFLLLFLPFSMQNNNNNNGLMAPLSAQAQMEPTTTSSLLVGKMVAAIKTVAATTISSSSSSSSSSNSTNNKYIPFTSNFTLPPRIVMVYNGIQHPGVLVSYKYRHGYTFGQLDIPAEKVRALLPSDVVNIKKGSFVQFFAKGDPAILPPSSLSIDAYTSQGKAAGVLNITKSTTSTFALNLNEGKYILLAVATWLPRSEDVTGYTIFSYMVNVVL